MARRRRRRKSSYEQPRSVDNGSSRLVLEELSPRARRLVEGGLIDPETVSGSGDGGKITSGDILHAARVLEVEQSVARIEVAALPPNGDPAAVPQPPDPGPELIDAVPPTGDEPAVAEVEADSATRAVAEPDDAVSGEGSATFTSVHVGGEPIAVESSPWEGYNGSTDGFSDLAREGAERSWGEAEAHLAAMAEEAAAQPDGPAAAVPPIESPEAVTPDPGVHETWPPERAVPATVAEGAAIEAGHDGPVEGGETEMEPLGAALAQREEMMDFGTLEHVDPESVWAQGAEDFAPWFLAHSQQLGAVLGLQAGLSDARQFTTKSATGVLGRDDNGEDVVVVSSKNSTADDSDLGRALGMAASSGAASVALVSAALHEDQLKALAWLNSQTRSGVKWYGIEMSVVRIADSPAAMLFDLVASPLEQEVS